MITKYLAKLLQTNKFTSLIRDDALFVYGLLFRHKETFTFQSNQYKYLFHLYNRTATNERTVEIPIGIRLLKKYSDAKILEVGNVLSHYTKVKHDIVDKYELAPGVKNVDIVDYRPHKKYDLIISLSTLEHVGQNYGESLSPQKFSLAVKHLKQLLNPGGLLFITLPVKYNPTIYQLIYSDHMPFSKNYFMRRNSYFNQWQESKPDGKFANVYASYDWLYLGEYFAGDKT